MKLVSILTEIKRIDKTDINFTDTERLMLMRRIEREHYDWIEDDGTSPIDHGEYQLCFMSDLAIIDDKQIKPNRIYFKKKDAQTLSYAVLGKDKKVKRDSITKAQLPRLSPLLEAKTFEVEECFSFLDEILQITSINKHTHSKQYKTPCEQVLNDIRALGDSVPLPHDPARTVQRKEHLLRGKFRAAWSQMINYLENKENLGKPLHHILRRNLEKFILDNNYNVRYQYGLVSDTRKHRWNIFAKEYSLTTKEFKREPPTFLCDLEGTARNICLGWNKNLIGGLINVATRNPLGINEQKLLVNKLRAIKEAYNEDEEKISAIIQQIINRYIQHTSNKVNSSDSSTRLAQKLLGCNDFFYPMDSREAKEDGSIKIEKVYIRECKQSNFLEYAVRNSAGTVDRSFISKTELPPLKVGDFLNGIFAGSTTQYDNLPTAAKIMEIISRKGHGQTLTSIQKWDAIFNYIIKRDDMDGSCLKNNGKALFLLINDIVMQHHLPLQRRIRLGL